MPATSVGEIGLDLVVNKNQFEKQMSGIQSLAKKAGAALAGAFAVKKVVDFGKECLELGSDLQEVQNVVDVTFPGMTKQVDEFAQSAAHSFGLSETMAKRFSGTFGSMAKAFGFSEQEAYNMGTTLAGLAGDVASFYNITQDEAYTKLKSVFTGETESLKDLGVVMTQTALDSYALANGFGKTTESMTEAEKVALRYQFVQSQLSSAAGDFARTSGSWANQCRILSLQLQSIMATIGQGLINLFTPAIKIINAVIGKIATLANAFKAFTELITGKSSSGQVATQISDMGDAASNASLGMESASDAADSTASSAKKAGNAAKKAAEQIRSLMGFDKINKVDSQNTVNTGYGDQGNGNGTDTGSTIGNAFDFGSLAKGETVLDETDRKLQGLINRGKELANLFKKGFEIGFGNTDKKIKDINSGLRNIRKTAAEIFTDKTVVNAANNWVNSITETLGEIAGSVSRIGLTAADNLIGGFDEYLSENKYFIKDQIVSIFDASSEIVGLKGKYSVTVSRIFDIFSGNTAKKITSDIIALFSNGFLGVLNLGTQFVRDIAQIVITPVTENVDEIRETFEGILLPIGKVLDTLKNGMNDTFSAIGRMYEEHIRPLVDSVTIGITTIVSEFLEAWNTYISPVLDNLADKFETVWNEHIQPLLDSIVELIGNISTLIQTMWEEIIQPIISEFIKTSAPKLGKTLETVGGWILDLISAASDTAKGITDALSGVAKFLTGIFTQDWETATDGLKEILDGFRSAASSVLLFIKNSLLKPLDNFLCNVFATDWSEQFGAFGDVLNTFFDVFEPIWTGVKEILNGIITFLEDVFKGSWKDAWEAVKNTFSEIFEGFAGIAKRPINAVIGMVNKLIEAVEKAQHWIAECLSFKVELPGWIQDLTGYSNFGFSLGKWTLPRLNYLAEGGFVEKNTPQLAMIGDNRHQGEVVAPEDKLREMAMEAVRAAGTGGITKEELESIINRAVLRIVAAMSSLGFYLDGEELAKALSTAEQSIDERFNPVIPT